MARRLSSLTQDTAFPAFMTNLFRIGLWSGVVTLASWSTPLLKDGLAQPETAAPAADALCPESAIARYTRHPVQQGETLESIAAQYELLPATILALNPSVRPPLAAGTTLTIPPYNGTQINPPTDSTWRSLAAQYQVRADLLFELNGCEPSPGTVAFIPGVSGFSTPVVDAPSTAAISGYPLANPARILTGYGWQVDPTSGSVGFHSGVDLEADLGSVVVAVGPGVVAFVGVQDSYGNLVVVNHSEGLQTRYAQLDSIQVEAGQTVAVGTPIGTVGMTGDATTPHLHFEVRLNSDLGWVAEDPGYYIPNVRLGRPILDQQG
jgi:murein DD-endopeptidase MepM/ murein hydrolase activator NlpD